MQYRILLFLVCSVLSINVNVDTQAQKLYDQTRSVSGVSKFLVDLAQLNDNIQAPLDELKDAVNKLTEELSDKLTEQDNKYTKQQAESLNYLKNIQQNIDQANIDIAYSADTLENNLQPGKSQSENKLQQIESFLGDNQQTSARDTLERQQEHDKYEDRLKQHSNAVRSIDEALQLLVGLTSGGVSFSEAPMRQTIENIQDRLAGRDDYAPFITALMDLADSIRDLSSVKTIRDLLNDLRNSIVDTQNNETGNESENQESWNQRQIQLSDEQALFQKQINDSTYELTTYSSKIEQEQQFQSSRKVDLSQYLEQQVMEQSNMADNTSLNKDMRSQLINEIQAAGQANDYIHSANFKSLKSKVQP